MPLQHPGSPPQTWTGWAWLQVENDRDCLKCLNATRIDRWRCRRAAMRSKLSSRQRDTTPPEDAKVNGDEPYALRDSGSAPWASNREAKTSSPWTAAKCRGVLRAWSLLCKLGSACWRSNRASQDSASWITALCKGPPQQLETLKWLRILVCFSNTDNDRYHVFHLFFGEIRTFWLIDDL